MKRSVAAAIAVGTLIALAAPVAAHEEINPKVFKTGEPTFFTFSAANEQKTDLTKITLTAPKGFPFGATTKQPTGWKAAVTGGAITWTGGAVKPDTFEQWGFETDGVDQPGTITLTATVGFADGKSDDVKINVAAAADTASAASAATTKTPTVRTVADKGRANAALALGAVALVVGLLAAGLVLLRRPTRSARPADFNDRGGQDW